MKFQERRAGLPVPSPKLDYLHYPSGQKRRATIIQSPSNLSLSNNPAEFLGFIYEYQHRIYYEPPEARDRYRPLVIDLSPVKSMTLDAALVLTAEYHRTCVLSNFKPIIDDAGWAPGVRALFQMLGFYDLVEAAERTGDTINVATKLKFVPFVSADQVNGEMADKLIDALRDVAGQAPAREAVYAALVEAIMNVTNHAYSDSDEVTLVPSLNRWWAAGAFDPDQQTLTFAVYDQGVGIPATLPKRSFFETILSMCPADRNDADLIAGGIAYRRTSTDLPERGNGLGTICSVVEQLPGSYVRIWSGRGQVDYQTDGTIKKKLHGNAFCGTLILWNLKLPSDLSALTGAAA